MTRYKLGLHIKLYPFFGFVTALVAFLITFDRNSPMSVIQALVIGVGIFGSVIWMGSYDNFFTHYPFDAEEDEAEEEVEDAPPTNVKIRLSDFSDTGTLLDLQSDREALWTWTSKTTTYRYPSPEEKREAEGRGERYFETRDGAGRMGYASIPVYRSTTKGSDNG